MDPDPSVLDFIKTRIRYWRHKILHPSEVAEEAKESEFWIADAEPPITDTGLNKIQNTGFGVHIPPLLIFSDRAQIPEIRMHRIWEQLDHKPALF